MRQLSYFIASLLAATPASAEIVVQDSPRHLTCSAGPGLFESRIVDELASGGRLAGRIRFVASDPHPDFAPGAGFLFAVPRGRNTSTGVQLWFDRATPSTLAVAMRLPGGFDEAIVIGRVPVSEWIPVSTSLNGRMLEVNVAGRVVRRRLRPRSGLQPILMCNSGTFEFELDEGMRISAERFQQ